MNDLLLIHNLFLSSLDRFKREDPQLRRLKSLQYCYRSPLVGRLAQLPAGIYTLTGGRQVGKSTLLKQVLLQLFEKHSLLSENACYITGEVIRDQHALLKELQDFLQSAKPDGAKKIICIDEITYVDSWHAAIKFLADAGMLDTSVVILTGSDMLLLKETVSRLPGRRGINDMVDFHYYPLSFKEYLLLKKSISAEVIELIISAQAEEIHSGSIEKLYSELDAYLITGGYLSAINDYGSNKAIHPATYKIYYDWIQGDFLKRNKQIHYLENVLSAVAARYGSQVTFNALATSMIIQHHQTVFDYCDILQSMDALFIQYALREDKLQAAPKKAFKLYFTDPFIANAVCTSLSIPQIPASLAIEAAFITHIRRKYPTFYIKNKGEIDCAYIERTKFYPIEIKWTSQLKPEYFKQVKRYKNAQVGARVNRELLIDGVAVVPIPFLLIRFSHD